ncbi:MAG TPA: hypothetical protein DIT99_19725, partial [Candidatus Latescibacteria bacterium]|nr:hypothetical protein [Candidatus Latescibacterota bacterium]
MDRVFPGVTWDTLQPEEAGFIPGKFSAVKGWLEGVADRRRWRTMIVKGGYLVAEWGQGLDRNTQITQASIDKSFISCLLGI